MAEVDAQDLRVLIDRYKDNTDPRNVALQSLLKELDEMTPNPRVTRKAVISIESNLSDEEWQKLVRRIGRSITV